MLRQRPGHPYHPDPERHGKAAPAPPPRENQPEDLKRQKAAEEERPAPRAQAQPALDPLGEVLDDVWDDELAGERDGGDPLRLHHRDRSPGSRK